MASKSTIEWTDATWTPIRARRHDNGKVGVHCERVSEGCANCYAASHNKRNLPVHGTGLDFTILNRERVEMFVDAEMVLAPRRWKRARRIFVCSQTDLFGEFVSNEMIKNVMASIWLTPRHTYQILTKRPERMRHFFGWLRQDQPGITLPLPNVWLGVTAENQARADERIPLLLQTPAAKRFVSFEPLLGQIDAGFNRWVKITRAIRGDFPIGHNHFVLPGVYRAEANQHGALSVNGLGIKPGEYELLPSMDWAIAGGESGHGARPMHPDWARSLRDQCQTAAVPFLFKQHGEWISLVDYDCLAHGMHSEKFKHEFAWKTGQQKDDELPISCYRVGKKAAGRLLDGVEWNQLPEVVHA